MRWYKRTDIWAIIVSVISLIFSQLPPVANWVNKAEITTELGNRISIQNTLGSASYNLFIDLKNIGNTTTEISNLEFEITSPNNTSKIIPAESYYKPPSEERVSVIEFTTIKLNVGDTWASNILFEPKKTVNEEEEENRINLKTADYIKKKQTEKNPPRDNEYIEIDSQIVTEANNIFNKRFNLEKGVYKVTINAHINGTKTIIGKFNFSLFDYHIQNFRNQAEDYKIGFINSPQNPYKSVWATVNREK